MAPCQSHCGGVALRAGPRLAVYHETFKAPVVVTRIKRNPNDNDQLFCEARAAADAT